MKDNKFKITPDMLPKTWDYIDPENEQIPTEEQRKELENCPRFLYYVQKYRDKKRKSST